MCGAVELCSSGGLKGGYDSIEEMHYTEKMLCAYATCDTGNYTLGTEDVCEEEECRNIAVSTCSNHTNTDSYTCRASWKRVVVPSYNLCDDQCDCPLCDDEANCNGHLYGMFCDYDGYYSYVPPHWICDEIVDCDNEIDELGCDVEPQCPWPNSDPSSEELKSAPLTDQTRCSVLGEIYPYCAGYSDQLNCSDTTITNMTCVRKGYPVTVANRMVCHDKPGVKLCDDGFEVMCVRIDITCLVHKHQLCDEFEDCGNGADELHRACKRMSEATCKRAFGMEGRRLGVPFEWINDGYKDCENGEDEDVVYPTCGKTSATIRFKKDEEECEEVFLCGSPPSDHIEFENLCHKANKCGNENALCSVALDSPVITQRATRYEDTIHLAHCFKGLEEKLSPLGNCTKVKFSYPKNEILGKPVTELFVPDTFFDCDHVYGEMYVYLACMGKCRHSPCPLKGVLKHDICLAQYPSRVYTLADNDFLSFLLPHGDNKYHNNLYPCDNGRCVPYEQVCNLANDCGDYSDEQDCTNHFTCLTGTDYIPISSVCDGKPDCNDFSDECNDRCKVRIIENVLLESLAWFLGSLATVLNLIIIMRGLYTFRRASSVAMLLNKILILLIALGDFMIGIYLLAISVYHTMYYETFCQSRFIWLASETCAIMGILNTVGSQLSLFSMTVLSLTRVIRMNTMSISDEKNFKSSFLVFLVGFLIFAASFLLAVVPLFRIFEDFFVNGINYPGNPLFVGSVKKSKHIEIFEQYFGRMRNLELSWKNIDRLVVSMFSKEYGGIVRNQVHFYGNAGVCLFKYFVTLDDPQRVFVWCTLFVNILCFAAITLAYIVIHFISTKSSRQFSANEANEHLKSRNKRLQRKITLIIGTDFCCWIPFIVMCFLHSVGVTDASPYYSLFSIVVLPINSVINPLLYDDTIGLVISKTFKLFYNPSRNRRDFKTELDTCPITRSNIVTTAVDATITENVCHNRVQGDTETCQISDTNHGRDQTFMRQNQVISEILSVALKTKSLSNGAENGTNAKECDVAGSDDKNYEDMKEDITAQRMVRSESVVSEVLNVEKPKLVKCKKWRSQAANLTAMIEENGSDIGVSRKPLRQTNRETRVLKKERKSSEDLSSTQKTFLSLKNIVITPYAIASRALIPKTQQTVLERTSEDTLSQSSENVEQELAEQREERSGQVEDLLEMKTISVGVGKDDEAKVSL